MPTCFLKVIVLLWLAPITALAQQTDLSKTPLAGHLGHIHAVAYSPDGWQIVSGSF